MGNGSRKLFVYAVLSLGIFAITATTVPAAAYNQRITVYAVVPPQRVVFIDEAGSIYKIAGNTSDNIEPKVLDGRNQPTEMTDAIMKQYQNFLQLHGGRLEAGKIYNVNPVSVDTSVNEQTIGLAISGPSFSSIKY